MKTSLTLISLILMVACASSPEKSYQVDDFKQASIDYIKLADRKRQQEEYLDALELYNTAEKYALKRNDQWQIGISKLKRALVHITLNNNLNAETLVEEVVQANRIEKLDLAQAIDFVQAKLLLSKGSQAQAFERLSRLEEFYQSDAERRAYYRLMRWSHDYQQLEEAAVQKIVEMLSARYDEKQLNNIEILSFAYFELARWAVHNASLEQGQEIIDRSIKHFSTLELTPKITKSLKFAADFYLRHGLSAKSDYYRSTHQRLLKTQ